MADKVGASAAEAASQAAATAPVAAAEESAAAHEGQALVQEHARAEARKACRVFAASRAVAVLACLVMLASLFLPYVVTTGSKRQALLNNPQGFYDVNLAMTNQQAADLSLFEYARAYWYYREEGGILLDSFIIIAMLGALEVMTLACALGKRPFGIMAFGLGSLGSMAMFDMFGGGNVAVSGSLYAWGYGHAMMLAAVGIAVAASICMAISRIKARKAEAVAGDADPGRRHALLKALTAIMLAAAIAFAALNIGLGVSWYAHYR